jgi:AcrR family transcriptional regulator
MFGSAVGRCEQRGQPVTLGTLESTTRGSPALSTSRQEARTLATRRKLLRAAERIFARDGFEAARLEDIAAAAGYTRGAFYANFDSKEELFMALLEDVVQRRIADIRALMARAESAEKQAAALRNYYTRVATQRRWALIFLEYKLFAIRHPEVRSRLQSRVRRLRSPGIEILRNLSSALGRRTPVTSTAAAVAMGALSNALLLDQLVDAEALPPEDVQTLLGLFFDLLTGKRKS